MLCTMAGARSIDVSDEIELLSDPEQCTDIAHRSCPYGACLAQIGLGWRVRGAQDDLPGYRTSARGIPHGLGRDPILATAHFSFKEVHFHHVALDTSGPQQSGN